jgi:hypothetical protein
MQVLDRIEEVRRLGSWKVGRLERGVGKLAAAHRCPPSALDAAHAQGAADGGGPRGVRGGWGFAYWGLGGRARRD